MNKYLVPRDFYNLIADLYDKRYEESVNPSRTKKQVDFIEEHLAPRSSVLDVACGNGRHSVELSKRNFNVTGLDTAKGMILAAQKKASALRIPFVVGDMVNLPFRSLTFDAAICMWNSLQDILGAVKRKTAVQEMCRVLKQAGTVIIDLPNPYWAEKSRKQLEEKFRWPRGEDGDYCFEERVGNGKFRVFLHYFTHREVEDALDEADLRLIERYGDYSVGPKFLPSESEKCIIVAEQG